MRMKNAEKQEEEEHFCIKKAVSVTGLCYNKLQLTF